METWQELTSPMRDPKALEALIDEQAIDRNSEVLLEECDIDTLVANDMLKEISEHEVKGTCRSFTVSEPEKNRRRWILHPAWFNQYPVHRERRVH